MKRPTPTGDRSRASRTSAEAKEPARLAADKATSKRSTPPREKRPSPSVSESSWDPLPEYDLEKMPRGV